MAIADCSEALKLNPGYVKALMRRGRAYELADKPVEALADFKSVLESHPNDSVAGPAVVRLEPIAKKKQEAELAEMTGKLKEVGNKFLGMFGLSTDNFQMQEQPGGGYNVQFVQNPSRGGAPAGK